MYFSEKLAMMFLEQRSEASKHITGSRIAQPNKHSLTSGRTPVPIASSTAATLSVPGLLGSPSASPLGSTHVSGLTACVFHLHRYHQTLIPLLPLQSTAQQKISMEKVG